MSNIQADRKIKVAILFHRFGPYHWVRLAAAAKHLDVCAIEAFAEEETRFWDKVEGRAAFERITLFAGVASNVQASQLWRHLHRVLDQYQPRVFAVPGWSHKEALAAIFCCATRRIPMVMMSDSTKIDRPRWGWKEAIKRRWLRLAPVGLTAGTRHAEYLQSLGMPEDRIFFGFDTVDNEYFARGAAEARDRNAEARGKYGLPERYFLVCARFIWEKNLSALLEAYRLYRRRATDGYSIGRASRTTVSKPWGLVLLGDGPLKTALNSQISTLNLQSHVRLPGFIQYDELPVYYGLAGALILPSISETWGLAVNEAMASGLPVLVSNRCGCATDLVREGRNGFTFDPYNVEEMANLMLRLTETTDYGPRTIQPRTGVGGERSEVSLEEMGNASREIISQWGPERFADGLKQAVETALHMPPPRPSLIDRLLLRALLMR